MKITLCGSIVFYKEMEATRDALLGAGHEVKIPELTNDAPESFGGGRTVSFGQHIEDHGGMQNFPTGHEIWELKKDAIVDHFEKIDWADAILVVNEEKRGVKGYVGGNTLIEIGLAFYLKKPIYIMHPVSDELSYKHEINGMKPIILEGDLAGIK